MPGVNSESTIVFSTIERRIWDALPDAQLLIDALGEVRGANRRAASMFGCRSDLSAGPAIGERIPGALRRDLLSYLENRGVGVEDDEAIRTRVYVVPGTGPAGKGRPVEAAFSSVELDGDVLGLVALRDLTDFCRAERAIVSASADAEAISRDEADRTRLEEQIRQSQKLEAVGRLAGGVAHDFNNMLTVIIGHADLLLSSLDADNPICADLREILAAAERGSQITAQLMSFSRKPNPAEQVTDVAGSLRGIERMLVRLIGEDVDLSVRCAPDPLRVRIAPTHLEQILVNLAVNARDAMKSGGSIVIEASEVDLPDAFVRSHLGSEAGLHVLIAVSDDGCGMDREVAQRIFEPFFTTKDPGRGTGLGLANLHAIVRQHGGQVYVYSEVGRGTTFKIYFPLMDADGKPRARSAAATLAVSRRSETLLLADDDARVRDVTKQILETAGYRVFVARNGLEALELGRRFLGEIDVLITDAVMPGLGGRELATALQERRPELRVLYLSGHTNGGAVRNRIVDDRLPFLSKPFAAALLLDKVRDVLVGR